MKFPRDLKQISQLFNQETHALTGKNSKLVITTDRDSSSPHYGHTLEIDENGDGVVDQTVHLDINAL